MNEGNAFWSVCLTTSSDILLENSTSLLYCPVCGFLIFAMSMVVGINILPSCLTQSLSFSNTTRLVKEPAPLDFSISWSKGLFLKQILHTSWALCNSVCILYIISNSLNTVKCMCSSFEAFLYVLWAWTFCVNYLEWQLIIQAVFSPLPSLFPLFIQCDRCLFPFPAWGLMWRIL